MKIKKGDKVIVISGKDKGKTGEVAHAYPKLNRVLILGVNVAKRHQRARKQGQKGQLIEKPMPIHVSNVMIVDPKKGKDFGPRTWDRGILHYFLNCAF
jgi:large subunit ribosomal protein L24